MGMKNRTKIHAQVEDASLLSKNIKAIAKEIFKISMPVPTKPYILAAKITPPTLLYLSFLV